ncbi:MAG TPA: UDP-N-acetylmuramoyl-L-alanine--D-glutamate ligase [Acidimicrobiales bacterium]|nr:UDP-N-acetylmuramoyl-L-alanine--D-glutamate ligase [Acidimicrobiales bacterium]
MKLLVAGLARTGQSVIRMARRDGDEVYGYDDDEATAQRVGEEFGIERVGSTAAFAAGVLPDVDAVVVSPGFPLAHPLRAAADAAGKPMVGDVELAARRTSTPMIAVTGTNGKSTVVRLITEMLNAAGHTAIETGNVGFPILDAVEEPAEYYVVEMSSFQLADAGAAFHPLVAVWTNLTPDHLDWHPNVEHYVGSKAQIFANQTAADVAVLNAEDPVVMAAAHFIKSRAVTFGVDAGDARVVEGRLRGPHGEDLGAVADMARPFPHEITNGLGAACAALAVGVDANVCARVLREFRGLPHRIELVGHIGGVPYFDDSKATTPASVLSALRAFPSAVLIAGGKNKGLDLSVLAEGAAHVRSVIAIGAAAGEVVHAFAGVRPVRTAASMDEAVAAAAEEAQAGDAVLLSPACTSWDAYRDYAQRGDDFARAVREHAGATA